MDYVFRYLGNRYLEAEEAAPMEVSDETGIAVPISIGEASTSASPARLAGAVAGGAGGETSAAAAASSMASTSVFVNQADAPSCMDCGSIMIRNGACYKCLNCGSTSGCS